MSTKTQKAVVFRRHGVADEVLTLDTAHPVPSVQTLGLDDVLVKVVASALNPVDKIRVSGGLKALRPETFKSPNGSPTLGYDAAGVVLATGAGVDAATYKRGDEVMVRVFSHEPGTIREYLVSSQHALARKPANLSFEEAASLPLAGVTALQLLKRGGVTRGSKVFISGGAGGVGTIAIQLAKHVFGAAVVATTASAGAGADLCTELGADVVIDYKSKAFERELAGQDFDVAIDTTHESVKMPAILKPAGGQVITIADTPTVEALREVGGKPGLLVRMFLNSKRNTAAEHAARERNASWSYLFLKVNGKDLAELASYAQAGKIRAVIDHVYDMDRDWQAAVARSFSGRAKGKVVIRVSEKPDGEEGVAAEILGQATTDAAAEAGEEKTQETQQPQRETLHSTMKKQSRWRKAWDARSISLRTPASGAPLLASSTKDGGRKHEWKLSSTTSKVIDNRTFANAFTVVVASGEHIHLATRTRAEQRRWVKALRQAIASH